MAKEEIKDKSSEKEITKKKKYFKKEKSKKKYIEWYCLRSIDF